MSAYCPHCGETVGYFTQSHCKALAEQIRELESALHKNDRWNVETTNEGFRICRGDHEKTAGCEWEYYVPESGEKPLEDELRESGVNNDSKTGG
jgi:hypothetical protein